MKKYTMIFVSVILAIMISLIPNNTVYAASSSLNLNQYYDDMKFNIDINQVIDYLKQYEEDYYVHFTYSKQTGYYSLGVALKENSDVGQNGKHYYYHQNKSEQIYLRVNKGKYIHQTFSGGEFKTAFQTFKDKLNNKEFKEQTTVSSSSYALLGQFSTYISQLYLIYSNNDFILNNDNDDIVYYNGIELEKNEVVPSYYTHMNNKIKITSSFACDLNDREMERVTIDFSNFASGDYKFQYGIKRHVNAETVWYDLKELIDYRYSFNEYYNGTYIYARVLDSNDKVIITSMYQISNTELPNFDINIKSGLMCPIPNYDGDPQAEVITVDFSNVYFENYKYYYSYDSKTKYQINVTSEQLTHQIIEYLYNFIYFEIYDENNNLIYYMYNDVTSSNRLGYLPEDYEIRHNVEISDGVACDLDGNKIINVKMDFSNITKYVNHYNFDVVINGEHLGAIPYYQVTLNETNFVQNYDIKVYIDTMLYYSHSYTVGGLLGGEKFEDTYDNMLNNGNWNEDLNVEDVESMGDFVIQFLGSISTFIATFFDLLDFFFQRLNFWIKACIITLFIELVICKIIKGVRK